MNKETIEEIAEKLTKDFPHYSVRENMNDSDIKGWFLEAIEKGAKWQSENMSIHILDVENTYVHVKDGVIIVEKNNKDERMYSEDDVRLAYNEGQVSIINKSYIRTEEWFEQFKKK